MTHHVYEEIKRRILYLDYAPGQSLSIRDIATDLDVSPRPVREALIRLECEGLVRWIPNKGVNVAEVSLQEVKDIFETRYFLDDVVGALAVQRISDEDIDQLELLLEAFVKESDETRKLEIHEEFHRRLDASTGNRILSRILEMLHDQQLRLMLSVRRTESSWSDVYATIEEEFKTLVVALQAWNEDQVRAALRRHTLNFVQRVQRSTIPAFTDWRRSLDADSGADLQELELSASAEPR